MYYVPCINNEINTKFKIFTLHTYMRTYIHKNIFYSKNHTNFTCVNKFKKIKHNKNRVYILVQFEYVYHLKLTRISHSLAEARPIWLSRKFRCSPV